MNRILLIIISSVLIISCDGDKDDNTNEHELFGKWNMIEVLNDPGDGSGVFVAVETDKYLIFNEDETIESNGEFCNNSTETNSPSSGRYSLQDSTLDCDVSFFNVKFYFVDSYMVIDYPGIEPVQAKFVKE